MPYGDYDAGYCKHCDTPMGIQFANGGRYKQYCNDRCRKAAHRSRQKAEIPAQAAIKSRNEGELLAHELNCTVPTLASGLRSYMRQARDLDDAHALLGELLRRVEQTIREASL